jgi:hypothetical protein
MELTPDRLACLRTIAANGGRLDHEDPVLARFCDDASTLNEPDVFNQCHDAEWLISRHDDRTDSSTVYLTDKGRELLSRRE